MRYVRTGGGRMAHRPSCPIAKRAAAVPWNWAAGMTPQRIVQEQLALGITPVRFCTRCLGNQGVV